MDGPRYRTDLYRGTARSYDRFRVPYPRDLIEDLSARAQADGDGRLLDLACGTGQVSFAMRRSFAEVWAVDQEPDMIDVARTKATDTGPSNIRFVTSAAEKLVAPDGAFDLVTIGNAFHRLRRDTIARNARRWLRAGGYLALLWSDTPWHGEAPWQQALTTLLDRWMTTLHAHERVPAGWERLRADRTDRQVLQEDAGFEVVGSYRFPVEHRWTVDALIGLVHSTSFLPPAVLADRAADFERDVRRELASTERAGELTQTIAFAYELARAPWSETQG